MMYLPGKAVSVNIALAETIIIEYHVGFPLAGTSITRLCADLTRVSSHLHARLHAFRRVEQHATTKHRLEYSVDIACA